MRGLAVDNVLEFQVVMANESFTANKYLNPDLFWLSKEVGEVHFGVVTQSQSDPTEIKQKEYIWSVYPPPFSFLATTSKLDLILREHQRYRICGKAAESIYVIYDERSGISYTLKSKFQSQISSELRKSSDIYLENHGILSGSMLVSSQLFNSHAGPLQMSNALARVPMRFNDILFTSNLGGRVIENKELVDVAMHPAWRSSAQLITFVRNVETSIDGKLLALEELTKKQMPMIYSMERPSHKVSYFNLADPNQRDFWRIYWGKENYKRLLGIKHRASPNNQKTLPALLFYGTEGLEHWNRHSHQTEFYPRREEIQILKKHAYRIASTIAQKQCGDLGSASLDKVILLLEAIEAQKKNVSYYALDLSTEQLASTLRSIPIQKFQVCDLPLHSLTGLTIGNFSRANAAKFLRNIATHALMETRTAPYIKKKESSILVTIDSCKMPSEILRAYTAEGVVPFALAALKYCNFIFDREKEGNGDIHHNVFNPDEWYYLSEWNHVVGRHEASLIPRSTSIRLGPPLDGIVISKDEKVRFGCSYKYNQEEIELLFRDAGLESVELWSDEGCNVAFYKLEIS
ncbi:histidine-specific methyltransferase [Bisporella sp. PMI_857]|nr:histidine-specific methyltransferase [Bisporella sp. PMI_857]